jgi:hypothetical protein
LLVHNFLAEGLRINGIVAAVQRVGSHILNSIPFVFKICGNFLFQGKSGMVGTYDNGGGTHDLLGELFEG